MTECGINLTRHNGIATEGQVFKLEKNPLEKNLLIEKLGSQQKALSFLRKNAKKIILMLFFIAITLLTGLFIVQGEDLFQTKGHIIKIQEYSVTLFKDPELLEQGPRDVIYYMVYTIPYKDRYGWQLDEIADNEINAWGGYGEPKLKPPASHLPKHLRGTRYLLHNKCDEPPFIGQKVDVYYKLGKLLRNRSIDKPIIDTICRKK